MYQRGTGERFKYKDAVKKKFPLAVCRRSSGWPHFIYSVMVGEKKISKLFLRAEDAWADAWLKNVKS